MLPTSRVILEGDLTSLNLSFSSAKRESLRSFQALESLNYFLSFHISHRVWPCVEPPSSNVCPKPYPGPKASPPPTLSMGLTAEYSPTHLATHYGGGRIFWCEHTLCCSHSVKFRIVFLKCLIRFYPERKIIFLPSRNIHSPLIDPTSLGFER